MSIATNLASAVDSGVRQIGEISILLGKEGAAYVLCHREDTGALQSLKLHEGPSAARDLSTWAEDGHYRFTKGELSLKRGWRMHLSSASELLEALDGFYPAAAGLWLAERNGRLEVEHLRTKLDRQTGMYRNSREISDAGAQALVKDVCGPSHCCAKKILWQLDKNTALEPSDASSYDGVVGDLPRQQAIPLLCREACNHFVAEARKVSKAEKQARLSSGAD